MAFDLKRMFGRQTEEDFVEIDLNSASSQENKVKVKPFVLRQFEDINEILNSLREGYTIAVIDIKPLKTKIYENPRIKRNYKSCNGISGKILAKT